MSSHIIVTIMLCVLSCEPAEIRIWDGDSLRLGIHPLTTRHVDLWHAVQRLRRILETGKWREPAFSGPGI